MTYASLERRLERLEQARRPRPHDLSDEELDARIADLMNALGGIEAATAALLELGRPDLAALVLVSEFPGQNT